MSDTPYKISKLEEAILNVIAKSPVYAEISARLKKMPNSVLCPTMGVAKQIINGKNRVVLMYNPVFVNSKTELQLEYIVEHEFMHIILNHIYQRGSKFIHQHIANVAMDLAINCRLDEEACYKDKKEIFDEKSFDVCRPKSFKEIKLKNFESTETYYYELVKNATVINFAAMGYGDGKSSDKNQQQGGQNSNGEGNQNGEGGGQGKDKDGQGKRIDTHDMWDDIKEECPAFEQAMKEMLRKAKKNRTWGNIPGGFLDEIEAWTKEETVDWKALLKQFAKSIKTFYKEPTRKRPNRRYEFVFPGYKNKYKSHLLCLLDVSGSVGDDDLSAFLNEINNIVAKHNVSVDIWQFDTEVKELKIKNQTKKLPTLKLKGRGGTCFNAIFDHYKDNKINVNGFVIFTDGYAETPTPPPVKTLWILTPDGTDEHIKTLHNSTITKMARTNGKEEE